jgi:hypothetical protein
VLTPERGLIGISLEGFQILRASLVGLSLQGIREEDLVSHLRSIGGRPEAKKDSDLDSVCVEDSDGGVIAYFEAGSLESIELTLPWSEADPRNQIAQQVGAQNP